MRDAGLRVRSGHERALGGVRPRSRHRRRPVLPNRRRPRKPRVPRASQRDRRRESDRMVRSGRRTGRRSDTRERRTALPGRLAHRPTIRARGDGRGVHPAARRRCGPRDRRPTQWDDVHAHVPELNGGVARFEDIDPRPHRARHRARRRRHDPARRRARARGARRPARREPRPRRVPRRERARRPRRTRSPGRSRATTPSKSA